MSHKLAEPTTCNTMGTVSFFFGLIGGTGCSIVIKLLYQLTAVDSTGNVSHFEKPLFLTWIMFLAMAFALPVYYAQQALKASEDRAPPVPSGVLWWLVIPSLFDLAGTNFAQIGLIFTTVSYYQLLRCTVIIVTAFLKAFVLKQPIAAYMWLGVFVNIVAMVLVSITNFVQPEDTQPSGASNPALGMVFILLSCVVQGSQYIFEEKVMAVDNAPPLVVIGMEGLWGTVIMLVIFPIAYFLPGRDKGSVENLPDSFEMVSKSYAIQLVLFIFFITVTTYNIFCIYVTAFLSAIWHAILDNFRPLSVWAMDLVIFYLITDGGFGESWNKYSWIQFSGMLVLFLGTAIYNGSLRVPGVPYPADTFSDTQGTPSMRTKPSLASPALMQSPLLRRLSMEHESPGNINLRARAIARCMDEEATKGATKGEAWRPRALSEEREVLNPQDRLPGYGSGM
ncbi:unnamed protein product [Discosporangium mesarthrocarpum]